MKKLVTVLVLLGLLMSVQIPLILAQAPPQPGQEAGDEVTPTPTPTEEVDVEPTEEAAPPEAPVVEPTEEVVLTEEPTEEATPTEEASEEPTPEVTDGAPPLPPGDAESVSIGGEDVDQAEMGAAGATTANYTSMIFLANTTSGDANYTFTFYPVSGGSSISADGGTLSGHGATSVDLSDVSEVGDEFLGSAVIDSDAQLAAALMNYTASGGDFTITNGYGEGAALLYAPAVVNSYSSVLQTSHLYIQNASSSNVNVEVTLTDRQRSGTGHPDDRTLSKNNLAAGYAWHINMGDTFGSTSWVGSALIEATGGNVVATVQTLYGGAEAAFGMESMTAGSNRLCSPTAMWDYSSLGQRTYLAVLNPSDDPISIDLKYYDKNNNQIGSTYTVGIEGKSKLSFTPKNVLPTVGNYIGSATVDVFNAARTGPADALATHNIAFVGSTTPASSFDLISCGSSGGSTRQIIPLLLWDKLSRRSFIAIQNVSSNPIDITTTLYNADGSQKGSAITTTGVQPDIKIGRSLVSDFGVSSNWQGSMVIESTGNIAVLVTVNSVDGRWVGSYTGIPF